MFFLLTLASSIPYVNYTGYIDQNGEVIAKEGLLDDGDCWAEWSDTLNSTGWYHITLRASEKLDGGKMGYCIGYLEGMLTHTRIYQSTMLFFDQTNIPRENHESHYGYTRLVEWYTPHLEWLKSCIDAYPDSKYWRQINVIYSMLMGLHDGYDVASPANEKLSLMEMFVMVAMGDSLELLASWDWIPRNAEILQRCTGVIKMSPEEDDIYFAHNSWTDYRCLHSYLKKYIIPTPDFSSPEVFLSTQMGLLSSPDDFFVNGGGLMVFETTFTLQNRTLYTHYCHPRLVLNWMRTLLAMFTATNVQEWEDQFLKLNSGTYNNDYFVVDTKLLKREGRVEKDLIHVVAQLPGPFRWVEDLTQELYEKTFVASFNVPKIKSASDFMEYERAIGVSAGFCNYTECSRFLITTRESPRLKDFETFKHFMRYSGFERDAYGVYKGVHDHSCTISSRGDLGHNPNSHGGINTKATMASAVFTKMHLWTINSPSTEQYEPIDWRKPPLDKLKHDGLIDVWNFSWWEDEMDGFDRCAIITDSRTCADTHFCGWCGVDKKCMPGNKKGPYFNAKCGGNWRTSNEKSFLWMYITFPIIAVCAIVIIAVVVCNRVRKQRDAQLVNQTFNTIN
ncbi:Laminin A family protein [Tritrichomonas foetus]|uniref:Phospholipase B-like n=1 Tax=Tritrichomonas foetus TaxID=1144522 RepID=A0A1J4JYR9_9EUKA|nr:Laminin A family protein [Tritrichomonas foetus]|eukprot:OHT02646.1 Laminin A family protein [Tritrichomonas foetus]